MADLFLFIYFSSSSGLLCLFTPIKTQTCVFTVALYIVIWQKRLFINAKQTNNKNIFISAVNRF